MVGGGVVGSAIASFLRREPRFDSSVVVIERDATYARASSALSASSIRQQFSTPINIALSQFGVRFFRAIGTELAVDGAAPAIDLVEPGYLFLASSAGRATMEANHRVQIAEGADVELLEPDELRARFPWLATDGVTLGSFGRSGEGWFDGYSLLQAFRRDARAHGATYIDGDVAALERVGGRVTTVRLANGDTIECGAVVNAAGPWAARIAAMLEIDLPVRARRRCVFAVDARARLEPCPLVIDTSGTYFRPEGSGFICGISPPEELDFDDLPLVPDRAEFDEWVWPALAERVPAFEALKVTSSWAGYYDFNTFDQNGIVGPHPEIENFYFANGFSGHGLQQSPAVGRAVAEHIAVGDYRSLDLSPLGFERILAGRPFVERNII
ncbi:MAG: NAD(P)/FAD-dependent oxidoreductase [Vulcanimicrobiaceae bacterium]